MARIPSAVSDRVPDEQLDNVLERVAVNGEQVDALVYKIVDSYCAPIDDVIAKIQHLLDAHKTLTNQQLEFYIMSIPGNLYYVNTATEALGIRDDVSRLLYKEAYNRYRKQANGTVADKDQEAELRASAEALASVVYNRSYRMVKNKMDMAFEMLTALKKVVTYRITEASLSTSDTGRNA